MLEDILLGGGLGKERGGRGKEWEKEEKETKRMMRGVQRKE